MTTIEARIVCDIMANADGWCPYCAKDLIEQFVEKFPQFKMQAEEAMKRKFG